MGINLGFKLAFLFSLFLISGCTIISKEAHKTKITFQDSDFTIDAQIANTSASRSKGLMHIESMPQTQGMLFIYENEKPLSFWMANTKIPLDIIFLSQNKTIVDMQKMHPCTELIVKSCPNYVSKSPAKYAIEINQNLTDKYSIKIGQKAIWN